MKLYYPTPSTRSARGFDRAQKIVRDGFTPEHGDKIVCQRSDNYPDGRIRSCLEPGVVIVILPDSVVDPYREPSSLDSYAIPAQVLNQYQRCVTLELEC
jgi:hypothetical protein